MNIQQSSPNRRGLRALELKEQGKTLTEIADYMHVSSERTRQILLRAGAEVEAYRKFEELKERCSTFLQRPEVPADILSLTVDYLNLSPRAINCLKLVHIKTIGELISKTSIHLSKIKNMGKKTLDEIEAVLDNVGLALVDMPIRFPHRRLPPVSAKMRYALAKKGWRETVYREWIFNDDIPMSWEEAAIVELNRDRGLKAE